MTEQERKAVGRAIGRIPSGVFILTARYEGQAHAMLASWVQQAGFEPPAVSVAVAQDRPIVPLIKQSGRLALSVLGENDTPLMKKYARGIEPSDDPFEGMNVADTPGGMPVLADALGWLDCRVLSVCDFGGDHEIYVAEVLAGEMPGEAKAFTHQRGNGFHY